MVVEKRPFYLNCAFTQVFRQYCVCIFNGRRTFFLYRVKRSFFFYVRRGHELNSSAAFFFFFFNFCYRKPYCTFLYHRQKKGNNSLCMSSTLGGNIESTSGRPRIITLRIIID